MKKIILVLMICIFSGRLFAEDTMVIQCEDISIEAPLGWLVQYTKSPNLLFMYSPLGVNDTFQENMNITVEYLPRNYSVEEYMKSSLELLATLYEDFTLDESMLNHHTVSGIVNGISVKQLQYFFIHDRVAYVLTFSSNPENIDRYLEVFRSIADTFTIIN